MLARVILLLTLMLLVATYDRFRNGTKATRFQEYGFVLLAGMIGALIGGANDFITSGISAEYFIFGKGLAEDSSRMNAVVFGLGEGFSAGIMAGAACLYAGRKKSEYPPLGYGGLMRQIWLPVAGGVVFAALVPTIFSGFDPMKFSTNLVLLMNADQTNSFRKVWWIHTGLYAGAVIGLVCAVVRILQQRKRVASNPACSAGVSQE